METTSTPSKARAVAVKSPRARKWQALYQWAREQGLSDQGARAHADRSVVAALGI